MFSDASSFVWLTVLFMIVIPTILYLGCCPLDRNDRSDTNSHN